MEIIGLYNQIIGLYNYNQTAKSNMCNILNTRRYAQNEQKIFKIFINRAATVE